MDNVKLTESRYTIVSPGVEPEGWIAFDRGSTAAARPGTEVETKRGHPHPKSLPDTVQFVDCDPELKCCALIVVDPVIARRHPSATEVQLEFTRWSVVSRDCGYHSIHRPCHAN